MESFVGTIVNVLTLGVYEPDVLLQPDPFHRSSPRALGLVYDNIHCFFDEATGRTISQTSSHGPTTMTFVDSHSDISSTVSSVGESTENIKVLNGWYVYPPHVMHRPAMMDSQLLCGAGVVATSGAKVIVVCGDLEGNMSHHLNLLKFINHVFPEYAVLMFDYVGYGLSMSSTCEPTVDLCYKSAWQAVKYVLLERQVKKEDIIFWGYHHGCSIAAYCASQLGTMCRALIMERPPSAKYSEQIRKRWVHHLHNPVKLTGALFNMNNALDLSHHLEELTFKNTWYRYASTQVNHHLPIACIVSHNDDQHKAMDVQRKCPWAHIITVDKYDRGSLFLISQPLMTCMTKPCPVNIPIR